MPRARKPTFTRHKVTIADAISYAYGEWEGLAEECQEIVDNAAGTNLENSSRNQTLGETADTLTNLQEPDVPDTFGALEVEYDESLPKRAGRGLSRASRNDNACNAIQAVVEKLEELIFNWNAEDTEASKTLAEDGQALLDEIENAKSEAEGVEFPGMYG